MRSVALLLCLTATASAEPPVELPPFAPDRPAAELSIIETRTPEGLTLWIAKRAGIPKASVMLAVRGGSAVDGPGLEGMTELLASTVAEGTRTRSAQKIAEDLQAVGAELLADWSPDALFLQANGLAGGAGRMIDVVADVARNAVFPDDEVALVKSNLIERLAESESTPDFIGEAAFARAIFGRHPYRITHATVEVIRSVTPEILRRELARRFRPDRALLVVVGDVEPGEVVKQARAAFGGWTAGGPLPPSLAVPSPPPLPSSSSSGIVVVDRPGSVQSHIVVGRLAPLVTDADFWPALTGATLLGGMGSARVIMNLREDKGYSYSPSSQLETLEHAGLFELVADVRSEVTAAALGEIFYELDRLRSSPPSAEELARARRYQIGSHLVRNQSGEAVADSLARNWVWGLGPRAPSEFVTHTQAVTLDDLRRVSERLFPSRDQTVVIVGDAARLRSQLARFGKVTVEKAAR